MKQNIIIALLVLVVGMLSVNAYFLYDSKEGSSTSSGLIPHPDYKNKQLGQNNDALNPNKAQSVPKINVPKTTVLFDNMQYDFGKVMQNSTNNIHIFKFQNTGENPLIIENAKGSCGCTVPEYPKEPIIPGSWGEIKVDYKPGKQEGLQNKTVTITANTENPTTVLRISAQVEKVEG